ncbi:3-phosphoshikimate 1-carboxyvinyltransferase [Leuconostoc mesenteroides]|jgi:3-phosphoshikimate 1-carboxyvinyltransferase|uniref:3-phosphoshikimate 1-carboxyvinyltransferase n=1 Tax=Leuconostoc mesenteroides subsp. mesenteroides (strain ATCC 8293 / DSM 20343 / BCRC 11652 / CCM 1803 / JCM 6124 / NCDO 523 / NBRC 100496 / NCIMB 8023 / NCTC 12954 / NRRL B-1118 / 37Y) TaxID=203120 RepID=AROA_LEUMM|nr:3-phosphoshikimate 1-carboxyvinyltransferase [Leuconostoc mesenteroides]Q03X10.1 RecName: Full=3-phosphoshikimate 1-carboxyvinyltransferase; AltName: Full=5-enolpyruvylshikimate-3-phosphate synthase; Short=EPSP synthase; Short=EPSPS [Leuconostoc mesenteroides subsp. mesenteroides ATCC 8293]ABJ62262.1 3-phosphoshikimate 1-carboxyvinyltransferase [Leuconostoc mesenteroides subsp. mesenteroides ATCC 8293]MCT3042948.1 3-phosphoshikimate 1-carboxyvinyltransferase [Leuconostoc mesenteroides]MCT838
MIKLTKAEKNGLHGEITVPGDKSISHRALMFGAIAEGKTVIDNFLMSDDVMHTMGVFRALGVEIDHTESQATVIGKGLTNFKAPSAGLDMGNSGTSTRLLMGLLSKQPFDLNIFGDSSLSKRPLRRVADPLSMMNAQFELSNDEFLPAVIKANTELNGITYHMPVASAQVKSAILLAGIQAEGETTIIEDLPSRDHTERMLRQFGGQIKTDNGVITVKKQSKLSGQHVLVPSDISSAAFFMVAGLITPNSEITIKKVGVNPTRDGVIKLLERMGAEITQKPIASDGEPLADITVKAQTLHGIAITAEDIPGAVDELPILALAATQAVGDTIISGAEELRVKETDRISTVISELTKLGADIDEKPDGMVIHGGTLLHTSNGSTLLDSHGDHRIGMMNVIASLITEGDVVLTGEEAMSVSYPGFVEDVSSIKREWL